jgi:hypothetical protein
MLVVEVIAEIVAVGVEEFTEVVGGGCKQLEKC